MPAARAWHSPAAAATGALMLLATMFALAADVPASPGDGRAGPTPPDTPAKPPPVRLPAVVVTATGLEEAPADVPASIDVVTGEQLRRARPALGLAESLVRVPGVVVRDRQNQAQDVQVSIRGFGARATFGVRGLRLYADGIPASMPDGQGQVSHFALEAADRIEVLRGPFSALHGNSSGGVIAVFSAPPPDAAEFEAGALAGSDGLWRAGMSWRGPLDADGTHGLRADAARSAAEGWRDRSAWRRDAAQVLARGNVGGRGQYTLLFNHLDLRADDPQGLTAAELAIDRRAASPGSILFGANKTVRQQQAGGRLELPFGDAQSLAMTGWTGRRQTFQMLTVPVFAQASPTHGGGVIDLDRDYRGLDARWQWQPREAPATLTIGASHEVADEHRRGFENFVGTMLGEVGEMRRDERNRVSSDDVYVQVDWRPGERWRLNAGARHSRVRFSSDDRYIAPGNPDDSGALSYSRTSPVFGVLYKASDTLSLYANAGAGFETPTFAELAYRLDGGSGLNDTLQPARSEHVEAGLRWRRDEAQASAVLFHSRTHDELVVVANAGGRSYFDNAGLSRRRGVELAFDTPLATQWRLAASYTWLDARHREDFATCGLPPCSGDTTLIHAGARIAGLARHTLWSELRWQPGERTDVLLEARATSAIAASDRSDDAAAGHALFGLGVEHRFAGAGAGWRGFARVDNLLDREVVGSVIVNEANGRYYEPSPGRTWQLGLSATW